MKTIGLGCFLTYDVSGNLPLISKHDFYNDSDGELTPAMLRAMQEATNSFYEKLLSHNKNIIIRKDQQ